MYTQSKQRKFFEGKTRERKATHFGTMIYSQYPKRKTLGSKKTPHAPRLEDFEVRILFRFKQMLAEQLIKSHHCNKLQNVFWWMEMSRNSFFIMGFLLRAVTSHNAYQNKIVGRNSSLIFWQTKQRTINRHC